MLRALEPEERLEYLAGRLLAFFGEEKWRVIFMLDTWSRWMYLTIRLIN